MGADELAALGVLGFAITGTVGNSGMKDVTRNRVFLALRWMFPRDGVFLALWWMFLAGLFLGLLTGYLLWGQK
jgi:hypothetical protein